MERRAAVAIGVLLACCPCASALNPSLDINQYAHKAWTVREGFFKGAITALAQTPDGYLWLGTGYGLFRFDGVRSVPLQPPVSEHFATIRALRTARDGTLWIGADDGLASLRDGKLTRYPELAGSRVYTLFEDRQGTIWTGTNVGGFPPKLCAVRGGSVRCDGQGVGFGARVRPYV